MSRAERKPWIIFGGLLGVVAFTSLLVVWFAWKKYFTLQLADSSWDRIYPLFSMIMPCGFAIGSFTGYKIALKSREARIDFLQEGLFFLLVVGLCHYGLSRLWDKPETEAYFWLAVAWDLGPIVFASWLWLLIARSKKTL